MFEQVVQASEAMREAARRGGPALIPALSRCRVCRNVRIVTSPALGICQNCGGGLTLIGGPEPRDTVPETPGALAA